MLKIPSGISPETVQLNLNDNTFEHPVISRANFTRYVNLEQLYLTGCGIQRIQVDTFIDNKKLKWLDIGKNRIKTIFDYTFRDLTLDHLFLNDNPGMKIQTMAFGGLKTTGLYIQNNFIDKLSLEVLRPLKGTLKTLWLDGNKFDKFNSEWIELFKTLSHLRIGDNPLHCNCESRWLFEFYTSTSRIFEGGAAPSCLSPGRLRGKTFIEMQVDDFKCRLPVFKNVDVIFDQNTAKMSCMAGGDPVPSISWIKPDGDSQVFIPKSEDIEEDMEGVIYVPNPRVVSKNRYQCVANNPAGSVTFSINVAWPTPSEQKTDDASENDVKNIMKDASDDHQEDVKIDDKDEETKKHNYYTKDTDVKDIVNNKTNNSGHTGSEILTVSPPTTTVKFSVGDIVGAVIGTFLLTLLACILVFHVFYRNQRKTPYPSLNGIYSTHEVKKGPPSRFELDEVEHNLKMLEKPNIDICV